MMKGQVPGIVYAWVRHGNHLGSVTVESTGPVDFGVLASSNSQLDVFGMYQAWKTGGTQDFKSTRNYPDPTYGDNYNRTAIGNFNFGASLNEKGLGLNEVQFWAGVGAEIHNETIQLPFQAGQFVTAAYDFAQLIVGQPPLPVAIEPTVD